MIVNSKTGGQHAAIVNSKTWGQQAVIVNYKTGGQHAVIVNSKTVSACCDCKFQNWGVSML